MVNIGSEWEPYRVYFQAFITASSRYTISSISFCQAHLIKGLVQQVTKKEKYSTEQVIYIAHRRKGATLPLETGESISALLYD